MWTDLKVTNNRGHKFPPSLALSFKTRIKWPLVLAATASFPSVVFQLNIRNIQGNFQAFRLTRLLWWQKLTWYVMAFSQTFVDFAANSALAVSYHSTRSHLSQVWPQWRDFFGPITITLVITSSLTPRVPLFCSHDTLTSSVIYYWTDARQRGIHLLNWSQTTTKCGKNKK